MEASTLSLALALKAKGIGPKGNRPLDVKTLQLAFEEMRKGIAPPAMEGAFVMAFRMMEKEARQKSIFDSLARGNCQYLSHDLNYLVGITGYRDLESVCAIIQKLLKLEDLNEEECNEVHRALFSADVPIRFKAAMLQGLRVKRESPLENGTLLNLMCDQVESKVVEREILIDLCEPYNGFVRGPSLSLYLACMLSSLGLPVVLHGIRGLGPKYGKTFLHSLDELGVTSELNFDKAENTLNDCGIACLDQEMFFPALAGLKGLRNDMLKRPYLSTVEKLLGPLRSTRRHIQVCGYVHSDYADSIPAMIDAAGVADRWLLVKGMEGGIMMDPAKKVKLKFKCDGKVEMKEVTHDMQLKGELIKEVGEEYSFAEVLLKGNHELSESLVFTASWICVASGHHDHVDDARRDLLAGFESELYLKQLHLLLTSLK